MISSVCNVMTVALFALNLVVMYVCTLHGPGLLSIAKVERCHTVYAHICTSFVTKLILSGFSHEPKQTTGLQSKTY